MTSSLFRFIVGLVKGEIMNEPIYNLRRGLIFPVYILLLASTAFTISYVLLEAEKIGFAMGIGLKMLFIAFPILSALGLIYAFSVKVCIFEEELQIKALSKTLKVEFKNVTRISLVPVYGYAWPFGKNVAIYSGNIGLWVPFFFFSDGEDAINFVASRVKKYSPDAQIQL